MDSLYDSLSDQEELSVTGADISSSSWGDGITDNTESSDSSNIDVTNCSFIVSEPSGMRRPEVTSYNESLSGWASAGIESIEVGLIRYNETVDYRMNGRYTDDAVGTTVRTDVNDVNDMYNFEPIGRGIRDVVSEGGRQTTSSRS